MKCCERIRPRKTHGCNNFIAQFFCISPGSDLAMLQQRWHKLRGWQFRSSQSTPQNDSPFFSAAKRMFVSPLDATSSTKVDQWHCCSISWLVHFLPGKNLLVESWVNNIDGNGSTESVISYKTVCLPKSYIYCYILNNICSSAFVSNPKPFRLARNNRRVRCAPAVNKVPVQTCGIGKVGGPGQLCQRTMTCCLLLFRLRLPKVVLAKCDQDIHELHDHTLNITPAFKGSEQAPKKWSS